jgi:hypothetical protein
MIKLSELMEGRLLSERMNMMLSKVVLVIEGRISDFRKKYRELPQEIMDIFIEGDPSGVNKYLDWLGRVASIKNTESRFSEDDAQELMKWINIFDKKARGVDIYSFKDIDGFVDFIVQKDKEVGKRKTIESQAKMLFVNEYMKVVAPETHEASMHFGGSTRWCISTSNKGHWKQYYCEQGDSVVFVIFRKTGEKYAIVGDDINYATIYDNRDNELHSDEKSKLLLKLQEEVNAEGETAWDAISDHIEYDDRNERRSEYEQEKAEEDFEDYGKKELDKSLKKIIANEILNLSDTITIDDKWDEYVNKAFENSAELYTTFLRNLWFNSISYNGFDSAGDISDMKDVYRYDEGEHEEELHNLINLIKSDIISDGDLDNIVKNVLDVNAYEALINTSYDEYASAIRDVKKYLDNTLNDPSQKLLSFGGKLVPTVKSFKELVKLMDKLDHTDIAIKILQYASGNYNKELRK